jgi:predicted AAA+ superfamily ATPase
MLTDIFTVAEGTFAALQGASVTAGSALAIIQSIAMGGPIPPLVYGAVVVTGAAAAAALIEASGVEEADLAAAFQQARETAEKLISMEPNTTLSLASLSGVVATTKSMIRDTAKLVGDHAAEIMGRFAAKRVPVRARL